MVQKAKSPTPPAGWQLGDERRLTRKLWFPNAQVLSLYVVYLLALAAQMRVDVSLAISGCWLSVMLSRRSLDRKRRGSCSTSPPGSDERARQQKETVWLSRTRHWQITWPTGGGC